MAQLHTFAIRSQSSWLCTVYPPVSPPVDVAVAANNQAVVAVAA